MLDVAPVLTGDTKDRILDAAEALFMEHGFAATSLRQITQHAAVNLAAVNYHFGSKDDLIAEIFRRRLAPLNRRQLELLDTLEAAGRPVPLRAILHAFVAPALAMSRDPANGDAAFIRLLGRAFTKPAAYTRDYLPMQYAELLRRYKQALSQALPGMSVADLSWRMHFMLGALAYTLSGNDAVNLLDSGQRADGDDVDVLTRRLVDFLVAGFGDVMAAPTGESS